ncbi:hypothetical protein FQR65_LT08794 [Abscondita terminalis]|nr:hypothetical protein FQR65_LT08794 [Abscondita terminalis]
MGSNTFMEVELDLMSDTINKELATFKDQLLSHSAMNNIRNNEEFQNYLNTQLNILLLKINCELYTNWQRPKQRQTSNPSTNIELEKLRCIVKLQNLSMMMDINQRQESNDRK